MDLSESPFMTMTDQPLPPKPHQGKAAKVRRGAEDSNRTAYIHGNQLAQYGDNLITTSKYTWWSFFARSLFEQ